MIATAAFAGILIAGDLCDGRFLFSRPTGRTKMPRRRSRRCHPRAASAAAHRAAAIVVETDKKGRCEERRFDNRTGKIVSSTFVDCDARLRRTRHDTVGNHQERADAHHPRRIQAITRKPNSVALQNNVLHHRIDLVLPGSCRKIRHSARRRPAYGGACGTDAMTNTGRARQASGPRRRCRPFRLPP